eukprot:scaffold1779_cov373-Prasinococcus_capsulatus_cf.AAC.7
MYSGPPVHKLAWPANWQASPPPALCAAIGGRAIDCEGTSGTAAVGQGEDRPNSQPPWVALASAPLQDDEDAEPGRKDGGGACGWRRAGGRAALLPAEARAWLHESGC